MRDVEFGGWIGNMAEMVSLEIDRSPDILAVCIAKAGR